MATITIADALIVLATICGPILAVQTQKWLETFKEERKQKVWVFSTLMTTRATKIAADHVRALNTIDLAFRRDKEIIDLWRVYHDALAPIGPGSEDKFIDLMYAMGKRLGYDFDKVMLKRIVYLPQGHVDEANAQAAMRESLTRMMTGQQEIQKGLADYLSGRRTLRVSVIPDEEPDE